MGFYPSNTTTAANPAGSLDFAGIMRQVFLWMAIGLSVCFGVAFAAGGMLKASLNAAARTPAASISTTWSVIMIGSFIAYLVLAFTVNPVIMRASIAMGRAVFLLFAAVFGLMISSLIALSPASNVAIAFGVTAVMFGSMAAIGYTTKTDLSKMGSILTMVMIGLFVASLVNLLLRSEMIMWLITYGSVIVFAGMTAYDMQWIKNTAMDVSATGDALAAERVATLGAFHLFYDFVVLFINILRIVNALSSRR